MSHHHDHSHAPRVLAAEPTFSLLRLSGLERVVGAGAALAVLWALVFWVMA